MISADLRIRLEGRAEQVEELCARWERTAAALAGDDWNSAERWEALDTMEDLEAVAALESHEESHQVLSDVRRHRERANRVAAQRLAQLGDWAGAKVEREAFARLMRHLPLIERHITETQPFVYRAGAAAGLLVAYLASLFGPLVGVPMPFLLVLIFAVPGAALIAAAISQRRLVVTQQLIRLGPRVVPLDDVARVGVSGGVVALTLRDESIVRLWLGSEVGPVKELLNSRGFTT